MQTFKASLTLLGCTCLILLLTGCASVMCGPRQDVAIDSRPRGAQVLVYNPNCEVIFTNTTPCVTTLSRRTGDSGKNQYIVLVKREGYAAAQIPLVAHVNSAYYLNLLSGGLGFIIDPLTGSMWTLSPEAADGHNIKDNAGFFDHEGLFVALKANAPDKPAADAAPVAGPGIAQSSPR